MSEEKGSTVLGHLKELRKRLLWSAIAVVITTLISFFFVDNIFEILKAPAGDIELQVIEMTEGFATYMRVALVAGIILAMPFITYQFLMFVLPALTRSEKKNRFYNITVDNPDVCRRYLLRLPFPDTTGCEIPADFYDRYC